MAFNGSSGTEIQGNAVNIVHGPQSNIQNTFTSRPTTDEEILRDLARRAAMNAAHDSDPVSALNCHPGTRMRILRALDRWISERRSTKRVYWVHGSASVGKSAIAQKVAESHRERLVGAFFFSRNDQSRDRLEPFVATIAYQCCTSSHLRKVVGPLIIDAIRSDPNIFDTPAKVQFRKLILEPFSQAKWSWRKRTPNLLVVDGIDECIEHLLQQKLIEIVDYAVTFPTPTPFIFLLCSRHEPQIKHWLDSAGFTSSLNRIEVSGTTIRFTGVLTESDLDIQKYFLEKFAELRRKYHGVLQDQGETWPIKAERYRKYHGVLQDRGETWPTKDDIAKLVWRASGQFIFAVTVIKFVDADNERPQDRLKTIMRIKPGIIQESPYPALDLLYRQILSTCRHWDKVHPILRLLFTTPRKHSGYSMRYDPDMVQKWHTPAMITKLLQLRTGDVEMVLSQLCSVLHLPDNADSEIRVLHASFPEFLADKARSGDFFVLGYSQEEFNDLAAIFLLSILSPYTAFYPPYCNNSAGQPANAAITTKWQEEAKISLTSRTGRLTYLAVVEWTNYCHNIHHPSASLLSQLDDFNPYVVMSLVTTTAWMESRIQSLLADWRACLKWAKALQKMAPQTFIRTMKRFFEGDFYIGYNNNTLRHDALRMVLSVEWDFLYPSTLGQRWTIPAFVRPYYQRWWPERQMPLKAYPLLLHTQPDRGVLLPKDWVAIRVWTVTDGRVLFQAYRIRNSLNKVDQLAFDNDVIYDTSECVVHSLVKEEDLTAFKALLYKRRDSLANLRSKLAYNMSSFPGQKSGVGRFPDASLGFPRQHWAASGSIREPEGASASGK